MGAYLQVRSDGDVAKCFLFISSKGPPPGRPVSSRVDADTRRWREG